MDSLSGIGAGLRDQISRLLGRDIRRLHVESREREDRVFAGPLVIGAHPIDHIAHLLRLPRPEIHRSERLVCAVYASERSRASTTPHDLMIYVSAYGPYLD